jgi:hypothetical protein
VVVEKLGLVVLVMVTSTLQPVVSVLVMVDVMGVGEETMKEQAAEMLPEGQEQRPDGVGLHFCVFAALTAGLTTAGVVVEVAAEEVVVVDGVAAWGRRLLTDRCEPLQAQNGPSVRGITISGLHTVAMRGG